MIINRESLKSLTIILFYIISTSVSGQEKTVEFKEAKKDFPRLEKNLRKWDAPVVADLDKDGYLDLLINDHGLGVQVQWNNQGKFAKPFDIIMGDLHGVAVGDIDNDGYLEMILSRGGGSGSNARNSKIYKIKNRKFIPIKDFKEPLALMRGRTVKFVDLDNDGDLDLLNFAFPDGAKKGASENYIYQNNGKGELILHSTIPASKGNGQKTLVTDFNNDNQQDFILYGHNTIRAFQNLGNLNFTDVTKKIFPFDIDQVTAIAEIDYDNDGDFDLFFTRGTDFEKGETFYNKETKTLGFYSSRGLLNLDDFVSGEILSLENFQSQWPNNDTYFIGEASYDYVFDGETHSGKDINLVMSNALGYPDNPKYKEKKGWYIGYVGNSKWRIGGFLWAPVTGVIHNVKSYVESSHKEAKTDLLLEYKNNKFIDVTKKSNLFSTSHNMATVIADYDNNGYQDVLVIHRGKLVYQNESTLYLNKGDKSFKTSKNHQIITKDLGGIGMAAESIDYNNDGKIDIIIGDERAKWNLFKNTSNNNNNYIVIKVDRLNKTISSLGAKVQIEACGKKQMYRIGTSASQYSQGYNNFVHFGLDKCSKKIEVKVTYSNGETIKTAVKKINQIVSVTK